MVSVYFCKDWDGNLITNSGKEIRTENELYKMNGAKLKMRNTDVHFDNEVLIACALLT